MEQKETVEATYKGKTKDEKNVELVLLHFSREDKNFYVTENNYPNFHLQEGELYELEITRNISNPNKKHLRPYQRRRQISQMYNKEKLRNKNYEQK